MPIFRTIKNNSVAQAMFFGTLTGLIGVGLFVLFLQLPSNSEKEMVPTTSQSPSEQETVSQAFFALQHGVFSNFDSAAEFLATYPTLNKAAIFEVDGQFYIWSQIDNEKIEGATKTSPISFYKSMNLTSSCPTNSELQLPRILKDENWLTQVTVADDLQNVPKDWVEKVSVVQKLTNQPSVIRLHILMNYYEQLDCLKVTF